MRTPHHRLPLRRPAVARAAGLAACLLAATATCALADVRVEAEVNSRSISEDETLELAITVHMGAGDSAAEPLLEDSDDFAVIGSPRREQGYSMVNMKVSKYMRRVYRLQPLNTGTLTVPSAAIEVNDKTHRTQQIRVQVTQGPTPPRPPSRQTLPRRGPQAQPDTDEPTPAPFEGHKLFFIECNCDRTRVYQNQQVTLETRYYSAHRLSHMPGIETPQAQGFVTEDLPDPQPEYTVINYRRYIVYTNRWALFPTTPGTHTVSAAPEKLSFPPRYDERVFEGNEVTIQVKPLPEPPDGADFSGAVGRFSISMSANKSQVKAGEGVTVEVVIDGTGSPQAIGAPQLDTPDWCKVYQSGESRTTEPRTERGRQLIGGRITFEYLVVPRRQGDLRIPPVELLYFDPDNERYRRADSAAIDLTVVEGEVLAETDDGPGLAAIRHIHTDDPRLRSRPQLLSGPFAPIVGALCLISLLASAAIRYRRIRLNADPHRTRARQAAQTANRALNAAQACPPDEFYERVADAITQYLADRFDISASGTPADAIAARLQQTGVNTEAARRVQQLFATINSRRFAPASTASTSRDDLLTAARELIADLERQAPRT